MLSNRCSFRIPANCESFRRLRWTFPVTVRAVHRPGARSRGLVVGQTFQAVFNQFRDSVFIAISDNAGKYLVLISSVTAVTPMACTAGCSDDFLNLNGGNILAAALDDILYPIDEMHQPVVVQVNQVPV